MNETKHIDIECPQTPDECVFLINKERLLSGNGNPMSIRKWYGPTTDEQRRLFGGGATMKEIVEALEEGPEDDEAGLDGLDLPLTPRQHRLLSIAHEQMLWNSGGKEAADAYAKAMEQDYGLARVLTPMLLAYLRPTAVVLVLKLRKCFMKMPPKEHVVHSASHVGFHAVSSEDLPRTMYNEYIASWAKCPGSPERTVLDGKEVTLVEHHAILRLAFGPSARNEPTGVIDLDKPWSHQTIVDLKFEPQNQGSFIFDLKTRHVPLTTGQKLSFLIGRPCEHAEPPQNSTPAVEETKLDDESDVLEACDTTSCVVPTLDCEYKGPDVGDATSCVLLE